MTENVDEKMQENLQEKVEEDNPTAENEQMEENNEVESNEVESLRKEVEELNQRLLRVAADFDNFRKRTRTEKEDLAKYANSSLVADLLPVLDNFQRALDVKEPSDEVKKFLTGVEMVYRQFLQILEQSGLQTIAAVGQTFDPQKHDAVMQVEDNTVPDNSILEELRCGYMYKDKVLRPSMVKVAKN